VALLRHRMLSRRIGVMYETEIDPTAPHI
jgi:hypothetical protein